jgi:hypothetical protein
VVGLNTDRYLRALTAIARGDFEANRAELIEQLGRDKEENDRELEYEIASRVDTEAEEEEIIFLLERSVSQDWCFANQSFEKKPILSRCKDCALFQNPELCSCSGIDCSTCAYFPHSCQGCEADEEFPIDDKNSLDDEEVFF